MTPDIDNIFSLPYGDEEAFRKAALGVFRYQHQRNKVYRTFCDALEVCPGKVSGLDDIPYLPIGLFKKRRVTCFEEAPGKVFVSSGTTGALPSRHYVADTALYERSFRNAFRLFYGDPADYCILALLPGYLERGDASLVYMVNTLIEDSGHPDSGFYLDDVDRLASTLKALTGAGQKIMLLGVSFALLHLAETHPMPLKNTVVMETGGMKGRRREMVRDELHEILCSAFHQESIHSEYGMTELLSQAYSHGKGQFYCPPWMRVTIRDTSDPLRMPGYDQGGGLNIIDLANVHSCSFIATQDLGKLSPGGGFEVSGRFDHSDVRGCNLMATTGLRR